MPLIETIKGQSSRKWRKTHATVIISNTPEELKQKNYKLIKVKYLKFLSTSLISKGLNIALNNIQDFLFDQKLMLNALVPYFVEAQLQELFYSNNY